MLKSRPIQESFELRRQIGKDRVEDESEVIDHLHQVDTWFIGSRGRRPRRGPLVLAHAEKAIQFEPNLVFHSFSSNVNRLAKVVD